MIAFEWVERGFVCVRVVRVDGENDDHHARELEWLEGALGKHTDRAPVSKYGELLSGAFEKFGADHIDPIPKFVYKHMGVPVPTEEERERQEAEVAEKLPPQMREVLYAHQLEGINVGYRRKRILLADEPGLGKTIQALGIACALGAKRTLILSPPSLCAHWVKEVHRWTNWMAFILDDTKRSRKTWDDDDFDVCVVSYAAVSLPKRKWHDPVCKDRRWDVVVFDESHAIKGHDTQITKTLAVSPGALLRRTPNVVLISGTPEINRHAELWAQLAVVYGQDAPFSYHDFTKRYCDGHFDQSFGDGFWNAQGSSHERELHTWMGVGCVRRKMGGDASGVVLPPKTRRKEVVVLPVDILGEYAESRKKYEKLKEKMENAKGKSEASSFARRDQYAAKRALEELQYEKMNLQRISGRLKTHESLEQLVCTLARHDVHGQKTLFFANLEDVRLWLVGTLERAGHTVVHIHGGVDREDREKLIREVGDENHPSTACVLSMKACNAGLNATPAATRVVFWEQTFEVMVHEQCIARAHRIGAKYPVEVVYVVAKGTLDEEMLTIHQRKQRNTSAVVDGKEEGIIFEV